VLCFGGCAAPISDRDVDDQLRRAGSSVHGLGGNFEVFAVNADSQMAAWTLAAEAAESGPLPLSRQLARRMQIAARKRQLLVVGGPYPRLSRAVCLGALKLDPSRELSGLTFVYVGSAASAGDVRQAARARNVRFVHRELP
jgi:hypothetical protein